MPLLIPSSLLWLYYIKDYQSLAKGQNGNIWIIETLWQYYWYIFRLINISFYQTYVWYLTPVWLLDYLDSHSILMISSIKVSITVYFSCVLYLISIYIGYIKYNIFIEYQTMFWHDPHKGCIWHFLK